MKNRLNLRTLQKVSYVFVATALFSCANEDQLETNLDQLDESPISLTGKKVKDGSDKCRPNNGGAQFKKFKGDVNKIVSKTDKEIDDRTCYYNYSQQKVGSRTVGVYRLKSGTNHIDNLEPRIERATQKTDNSKNGNGVTFEGYCTIEEVGFAGKYDPTITSTKDKNGTYFIQAKGSHDNKTIGSKDPAILLLIAKPVFKPKQKNKPRELKHFQILSEQIKVRGGSGDDRKLVKITTVNKGQRFKVTMKNYFKTKTDQHVLVNVNGTPYDFDVPNTEVTIKKKKKRQFGNQAKIRFGAYRCKGGKAKIYWDNVKQTPKFK